MGVHMGFDMVPRLGLGEDDTTSWTLFIAAVKEYYKYDEQVKVKDHHILFEAADGLALPFYGPHFLRFSANIEGQNDTNNQVVDYIQKVRIMAIRVFKSRIRFWREADDEHGFYDWRDVHESSVNFYAGNSIVTASHFANTNDENSDYPLKRDNSNLYETLEIPGKGKGLVARCNIKRGTRILSEKPIFLVQNTSPEALHATVASKLKSLSREQQINFLSLHNNFPGKHAFAGLVRTNALPCGPGSTTGGIYPDICRINHSCRPNCHNSWNEAPDQEPKETIHAIRDIFAGEELSISYDRGGPASVRQPQLKAAFGFDCKCELCSLPAPELAASDARRRLIQALDKHIGDHVGMMEQPLSSLHACRELLRALRLEYPDPRAPQGGQRGAATALIPRAYYDALQIVVAHGDRARACVFAYRGYLARVECEGEDSPATQKVKGLVEEPSAHASFGMCGMDWETDKMGQPSKEADGEEGFEKWLWRL